MELYAQHLQAHLQAVEEARKGAFPLEDLHEMLDVLYRGEYL